MKDRKNCVLKSGLVAPLPAGPTNVRPPHTSPEEGNARMDRVFNSIFKEKSEESLLHSEKELLNDSDNLRVPTRRLERMTSNVPSSPESL